jgi:hypothetical protein
MSWRHTPCTACLAPPITRRAGSSFVCAYVWGCGATVCTENSDSHVVVMQFTKEWL